ncbi:hypothetical protein Y958_24175 [Nitrospirillum viridazoti CBAmc]|uniref:Uncharacterized protein n=1 Tax=Nitrospirillum viridazoti CBAmc TaxID=1441467 RepID=A0A248JZ98_9PROT|nr:hypothetical protein Y958_24175 [Nitrospirillum amazonense CBAmc]
MTVEHSSQFVQVNKADFRRARRHSRTSSGIGHPGGQLARKARFNLDIQDLSTPLAAPSVDAQALAMERMPRIFHDDKLRSVC